MPITRDFRATVWTRAQKDARYRSAMLTEAINELLTGDLGAGKAMLRDYVNATMISNTHPRRDGYGGETMKPAICPLCDTSSIHSPKGEWVTFLNYKHLDEEEIGHPEGLEWFCADHVNEAKLFSGKNTSDAIEALRNSYPAAKSSNTDNEKRPWWQRLMRG